MPQVQVIQPIQQQPKRLRVAAYARVSSDSEDQLNSLAVQVDYYTHLIQENPNWEFAGIYTDEGITGTSTKRREQFNRLMDDCRAGLIDRVLVKSASRFARNTADALSSVRELKSLGVTVAFEKEGFDTETSNGEMLLSIICAVAQEESLSISQNMKWGIHKRMRTGNYITNATPFGYTQINHQLVPEKNNAMIVNDIFKSYLSGMSINEIAEHLNTIYPKENSKWNPRTIHTLRPYFTDSHDHSYIPTAKEGALRPVPRHSRRKPIWHASKRCDHVEKATEFQREAMSPDGCSLGGACLTRLLALGKIPVEPLNARLDKDSRSNWSKYRICFIIHILSFAVGRAFLLPS